MRTYTGRASPHFHNPMPDDIYSRFSLENLSTAPKPNPSAPLAPSWSPPSPALCTLTAFSMFGQSRRQYVPLCVFVCVSTVSRVLKKVILSIVQKAKWEDVGETHKGNDNVIGDKRHGGDVGARPQIIALLRNDSPITRAVSRWMI